ncbi:MBL fold metallo-hydrolase [Modestobacter sp. NPDC049651]|uniref:MBL fold metallo-hydrolase n=1 Tax=unclassified Modestobacter TaxID=2643866 RepID=UPI0033F76E1C
MDEHQNLAAAAHPGSPGPIDLGGVVVERVVEQQLLVFDAQYFFPDLSDDLLDDVRPAALAEGSLDRSGELVLAVQSYVVRTPRLTVLVDTCVGNSRPYPRVPPWDQLQLTSYAGGLARLGLTPADVDVVVNTHLHGDHVGWNTTLVDGRWVPTFPNARYLFVREELEHWQAVHAATPSPVVADSVLPVLAGGQAEVVRSDHQVDDGVRLVHTPGHTPGHVVVRVDGARRGAVVTGDLVHSPIQLRHPDLRMLLDSDPEESAASRRRVLEEVRREQLLLCTGHFPLPSTGTLDAHADGFAWVPA